MNLIHFSSSSLFHVSSKKFSWITLSSSLFIPVDWSMFPQWKLSRILFLNELITFLVSEFIPCLLKEIFIDYLKWFFIHPSGFIPCFLHEIFLDFPQWFFFFFFFIPSGFLPCFLNENFHRFLIPNEFITFLISKFIPCFLRESFMDYPQWFFIYP